MNVGTDLVCDYELGDADLYSVKWYHDDQGFYRFYPGLQEPRQVFPIPGLEVDLEQSGRRSVRLSSVSSGSSGRLRCEVTTEGPLFRTVARDSHMTVIQTPSVTWRSPDNDSLSVECLPGSTDMTGANITFYINGVAVRGGEDDNVLLLTIITNNQSKDRLNVSCAVDIDNYQFRSPEVSLGFQVEGSEYSNLN